MRLALDASISSQNLCKNRLCCSVLALISVKMLSHAESAALEREQFYECLDCHEPTSNPLCQACLTTQIQAWLSSYPDRHLANNILEKIKKYAERTNNLAGSSTKCVACGMPRASLCPYCFTNHVFNLLKGMKVNRIILKEFLQFFNYDFEHKGYAREAEKLGVI